ncbi:MAG: 1-acyl-sn-glycerol-3-phosphate acyltransferase, partial [Bacteroidetes bacterium]
DLWIRSWSLLTGIRFRVEGKEHLQPEQAYVIVPNHSNLLDIPLTGSRIHHPWKCLVKQEILNVPAVGWIIHNIAIPVDRSSKRSRQRSLIAMVRELQKGISILIFPEGTRNRTPQPLKSFYSGAFIIAIKAQKPILPVVITGIRKLQPVDTLLLYPGKVTMTYLEPIPTEGLTDKDVKELMTRVYALMEAHLVQHGPAFQHLGTKAN